MRKQKQIGQVSVGRLVEVQPVPEPFTGFWAWLSEQQDGEMWQEALTLVGDIFVALANGLEVPVEGCQSAIVLTDCLYEIAAAQGFAGVVDLLEEARQCMRAALERHA